MYENTYHKIQDDSQIAEDHFESLFLLEKSVTNLPRKRKLSNGHDSLSYMYNTVN